MEPEADFRQVMNQQREGVLREPVYGRQVQGHQHIVDQTAAVHGGEAGPPDEDIDDLGGQAGDQPQDAEEQARVLALIDDIQIIGGDDANEDGAQDVEHHVDRHQQERPQDDLAHVGIAEDLGIVLEADEIPLHLHIHVGEGHDQHDDDGSHTNRTVNTAKGASIRYGKRYLLRRARRSSRRV